MPRKRKQPTAAAVPSPPTSRLRSSRRRTITTTRTIQQSDANGDNSKAKARRNNSDNNNNNNKTTKRVKVGVQSTKVQQQRSLLTQLSPPSLGSNTVASSSTNSSSSSSTSDSTTKESAVVAVDRSSSKRVSNGKKAAVDKIQKMNKISKIAPPVKKGVKSVDSAASQSSDQVDSDSDSDQQEDEESLSVVKESTLPLPPVIEKDPAKILHPRFLEAVLTASAKAKSSINNNSSSNNNTSRSQRHKTLQKDSDDDSLLLQRLQMQCQVLATEDERLNPDDHDEWPGLAALAPFLMQFIQQADNQHRLQYSKPIRLYATLASLELLAVFAPEVPWDTPQLLDIFSQALSQLANLAHTTSPAQPFYAPYLRILELMSTVRMPALLVELERLQRHESSSQAHSQDSSASDAMPVMADLMRTLIHLVRPEHSSAILEHVWQTLGCVLEEYEYIVPIPILEVLLVTLAAGPTQMHPARPLETQASPSYHVVAKLLAAHAPLATPVAALLNALLCQDSDTMQQCAISALPHEEPHVYQVIIELHSLVPDWLTTVLGTVASCLEQENVEIRQAAVQLLGQLFGKALTITAAQHAMTLHTWLGRAHDVQVGIRTAVLEALPNFLLNKNNSYSFILESMLQTIYDLATRDPVLEVRMTALQQCQTVLIAQLTAETKTESSLLVISKLLQALGNRVSAKPAAERRQAIDALAKVYGQYWYSEIESVNTKSVSIDQMLQFLKKHEYHPEDDSVWSWVPTRLCECVCISDAIDSQTRSRVIQVIDQNWLDKHVKNVNDTCRALIWLCVWSYLDEKAVSFLQALLQQRALLQSALATYLQTRAHAQDLRAKNSEEFLTADADALECLAQVSRFVPPSYVKLGSPGATRNGTDSTSVVAALHRARDKHIFRILGTIATPIHSSSAQKRALQDLPQRTQSLGSNGAVSNWVELVIQRCCMGRGVNSALVQECASLAKKCHNDNKPMQTLACLSVLQLLAKHFPALAGQSETFCTLADLLSKARSEFKPREDIITVLIELLAAGASYLPPGDGPHTKAVDGLRDELEEICLGNSSVEQARFAVDALMRVSDDSKRIEQFADKLYHCFFANSNLSLTTESVAKVLCTLSAIGSLAECRLEIFIAHEKSGVFLATVFNTIILGKEADDDLDDSESSSDDDDDELSESKNKKRSSRSNAIQKLAKRVNKKDSLSVCQRLCAALDLMASVIRSAAAAKVKDRTNDKAWSEVHSYVPGMYQTMATILQNSGLPTSKRDRQYLRVDDDKCVLRTCAAVNMIRLSDPRLGLERKHMNSFHYYQLSRSFCDTDEEVREESSRELSDILAGTGLFSNTSFDLPMKPPSLRFLAFVCFCKLSDHSGTGDAPPAISKATVNQCITNLRSVCDLTYDHCRAQGKESKERFDNSIKVLLMPEYSLPYALYLLTVSMSVSDSEYINGENHAATSRSIDSKTLKKRLNNLIEPLVHSLGDTADNLTFLIRITDLLGNYHDPIYLDEAEPIRNAKATDLKNVCTVARNLLLTFVKKDVHLAPYPGTIQLPQSLFQRRDVAAAAGRNKTKSKLLELDEELLRSTPTRSAIRATRKEPVSESRVHFSPDVSAKTSLRQKDTKTSLFTLGELSPIPKSASPNLNDHDDDDDSVSSMEIEAAESEVPNTVAMPIDPETNAESNSLPSSAPPSPSSPPQIEYRVDDSKQEANEHKDNSLVTTGQSKIRDTPAVRESNTSPRPDKVLEIGALQRRKFARTSPQARSRVKKAVLSPPKSSSSPAKKRSRSKKVVKVKMSSMSVAKKSSQTSSNATSSSSQSPRGRRRSPRLSS